MSKPIITINSRKNDGKIHRSWKAELLSESNDLLTFVGEFEKEVAHPQLGVIRRGTVSYEFYWKHMWFNIFRFHEPEGGLRNFYCNINQPPEFVDGVLDYIDLDIDILVWADFSYQILDADEYEAHALKYNYSEELKLKVDTTVKELISMIEQRSFPFDFNP